MQSMKTQSFGLSSLRSIGIFKNILVNQESIRDYRSKRENGSEEDNPTRRFPCDGIYSWEDPDATESKVRYSEGLLDAAWMEEKDRNYLSRLSIISQAIYELTTLPKELINITIDYLTTQDSVRKCEDAVPKASESYSELSSSAANSFSVYYPAETQFSSSSSFSSNLVASPTDYLTMQSSVGENCGAIVEKVAENSSEPSSSVTNSFSMWGCTAETQFSSSDSTKEMVSSLDKRH